MPFPYKKPGFGKRRSGPVEAGPLLAVYDELDVARGNKAAALSTPPMFVASTRKFCLSGAQWARAKEKYGPGKLRLVMIYASGEVSRYIHSSEAEVRSVVPGPFTAPYTTDRDLWVCIDGTGVKRSSELRLWVSGDGVTWQEKWDFGPQSAARRVLFDAVQCSRAASEARTKGGGVWADGVRAADMWWDGDEVEAAAAEAKDVEDGGSGEAEASSTEAVDGQLPVDDGNDHPSSDSDYHVCIVPGSVFETVGNGHCGIDAVASQVLGRQADMDDIIDFREQLLNFVPEEYASVRAQIFPSGVVPAGEEMRRFREQAGWERQLNTDTIEWIVRFLGRSVVVVIEDSRHRDSSQVFEAPEPNGPPIGLLLRMEPVGHYRGFEVKDDASLLPVIRTPIGPAP